MTVPDGRPPARGESLAPVSDAERRVGGLDVVRMRVREQADVAIARRHVRDLSGPIGLSPAATHALATAVSEIAQNLLVHAGAGELVLTIAREGNRRGLVVVAEDTGPGIADIARAMIDGYTTGKGLGFGLSSARRLVDDFEIVSVVGKGTTVTLRKWVR